MDRLQGGGGGQRIGETCRRLDARMEVSRAWRQLPVRLSCSQ